MTAVGGGVNSRHDFPRTLSDVAEALCEQCHIMTVEAFDA